MANDDLDDLLKELKNTTPPVTLAKREELAPVSEEGINQYIMDNASKLIAAGLGSVEALRDVISQSYEAKEIEAFATLIQSVAASLETVNKINLTNKKTKAAKEIKTMEIEARQKLGPNTTTNNTNVLIATRDEIIKGLVQASLTPKIAETEDVIDV
jgi:hypothetical protein